MEKTRCRRRNISLVAKIQRAQDAVMKARERYEKPTADLKRLLAVRLDRQQRQLMDALEKSGRSFEEVMRFLDA